MVEGPEFCFALHKSEETTKSKLVAIVYVATATYFEGNARTFETLCFYVGYERSISVVFSGVGIFRIFRSFIRYGKLIQVDYRRTGSPGRIGFPDQT